MPCSLLYIDKAVGCTGAWEFANTYLFSGNMPSGTNAVVEVIYIEKNGKLPATWFLQLDNTYN